MYPFLKYQYVSIANVWLLYIVLTQKKTNINTGSIDFTSCLHTTADYSTLDTYDSLVLGNVCVSVVSDALLRNESPEDGVPR